MTATLAFFPVDDGDMTLVELESGGTLLVDCHIRKRADDENDDDALDVAKLLKDRLPRDAEDRPYVDAFLLSHPDEDHCCGFERHFHVGPLANYKKGSDKIVIREIWSSPIIFRRKERDGEKLCADAEVFKKEAKRRVAKFKDDKGKIGDGDRIQIIGEDEDGKTDDLKEIVVCQDETITRLNGEVDGSFEALVLAPMPKGDDEEEEVLSKNNSSTILQFAIQGDGEPAAATYLTGGDAQVDIWERIWDRNKNDKDKLLYNVLLTPHHCSWHSLSHDSWSDSDNPQVSKKARNALSQTLDGALLIASSTSIGADDERIGARQEYEGIASDASGEFICVMEHPSEANPQILEIEIGSEGPHKRETKKATASVTRSPAPPPPVVKQGGGRYA